jgi:predicted amidohydrolase YtcJ
MMLSRRARQEFMERGMVSGVGDDMLRLDAVKLMLAAKSGERQDELNEQVLACHRDGFRVAFHAIEEGAVAAAVTALEYVDRQSPVAGRRHRIEHCAECPPPLVARLSKLGAVIVTQPPFLYHSGERYLATVDEKQLPWLYRIGAPLKAGIVVAGSSDAPVVPADPFTGICAAVTRRARQGQQLSPDDAVTPQQALALYTANAAYASSEEGIKGKLAPGMLADMAVLSADPTSVAPEEIRDIKVLMTIIGGGVAWED